jgi:hypothetical protein
MIVFKVTKNNVPIARAGRSDMSVLSFSLHAVGVLGVDSGGTKSFPDNAEFRMNISGIANSTTKPTTQPLNWTREQQCKIGDTFIIEISDSEEADPALQPASSVNDDERASAFAKLRCSFCNQTTVDVGRIVSCGEVRICAQCVELCQNILDGKS